MKLLKSKKGAMNASSIKNLMYGGIFLIVAIIALFEFYATGVPLAQTSGDTLCNTGVPLASFFKSSGLIFLIVMVGLLVVVLDLVFGGYGKK